MGQLGSPVKNYLRVMIKITEIHAKLITASPPPLKADMLLQ